MNQTTPSDGDLLRRLLGPAAPEISCDDCFEQLDRYVELELRGADADRLIVGMRAHLEGCQACREEHLTVRALAQAER